MEYRKDLEFSELVYSKKRFGLLTLGDKRMLELKDGTKIELLPYLIDRHTPRGTSVNDPRRRRADDLAIELLAQPYADHYNNAGLGEYWSTSDVKRMLHWQSAQSLGDYFFVKWARNVETGEEFPVGFFSIYEKPYQGGKILWDGELFVLPEYRNYGIAADLIEAVFTTAVVFDVHTFESLTYEDENGFPFQMWKKFGVASTDLIHI
ncbi:MAG: GNAT family N-acetyltransferase, partial [Bacilli bacterium]|nr:GNAT family N-acetyltransferase [Bacilli bacterium]